MARRASGGNRRSEGEWRALLARFAESGMGVEPFCRSESISGASFYRWRTRMGSAITAERSAKIARAAFVDLGVVGSGPSSSRMDLKLDLGAGVILHLVRS